MTSPARAGPPPAREAESEQPEPNPHLATPLWPQFVALGAINKTTASGPSSLSDTSFFRPRGLRVAVLQATSTLAILALYFLTVHPDSIVDVFRHYPATSIYDSVPVSQRHRPLLHPLDPANVSTSALQLSQYRSIREIDLFHIEDPEADQCAHVYGLLKLDITDLSDHHHFRSTTIHKLLIPWAQTNPHTRITVENPKYSVFLHMQDVIDLCNTRLLLCTLRGMSTTSTTASCTTQGWTHPPPTSRRLSSLTGTNPSKSSVPRQVDVTSCFRTASIISTAFAGTKTCLPNRNK